jgi:hypothetical protein
MTSDAPLPARQYQWSPPIHPDPPEDQPLGIDGVEWSDLVHHAPVWVRVEFSRTGWQRVPGFVDAATDVIVLVQFVHMGFAHKVWLPRDRVTTRELKARRDKA